jgi:hypothetical protein
VSAEITATAGRWSCVALIDDCDGEPEVVDASYFYDDEPADVAEVPAEELKELEADALAGFWEDKAESYAATSDFLSDERAIRGAW